jgi:hypothetical protein
MAKSLEDATNYNISLEEQIYQQNKVTLELMKEIKKLEFQYEIYYVADK